MQMDRIELCIIDKIGRLPCLDLCLLQGQDLSVGGCLGGGFGQRQVSSSGSSASDASIYSDMAAWIADSLHWPGQPLTCLPILAPAMTLCLPGRCI